MILTTKKAAHIAKFAEFVWFVWLCSNVQTVYWKMPPYLLGYNLHFLLKKNASFFLHILVVFGDFLKFRMHA